MIPRNSFSIVKTTLAGFFMGLANLVPGVSGGTMILVMGMYEEFIDAFSSLTRFKFSKQALVLVCWLFFISFSTIFIFAGVIQFLMENYLSEMLALFIGFTLGGVPLLFEKIRPLRFVPIVFAIFGFVLMGVVAFVLRPGSFNDSSLLFFIGGFIGSAAMILPGISGSYLLLVMGLYLPVLAAINDLKFALKSGDLQQMISLSMEILIPFGLGLVAGIVVLSNILKVLLEKKPVPTLALLLGILLGSVLGLYPFKTPDLSKMLKYSQKISDYQSALRVEVYSRPERNLDALYSDLDRLGNESVQIEKMARYDRAIELADIERARKDKLLLISYDRNIDKELRDNAKNKNLGTVPLYIIPNTTITFFRGLLALFFIAAGFFITFLLGRFESKSGRITKNSAQD